MNKKWIQRINLSGDIANAIDSLKELQKIYSHKKYRIITDSDNEHWLIDSDIEAKEENAKQKFLKKEEKKEYNRLLKKFKKVNK